MEDYAEEQMALYNYIVDVLTDMADPLPEEIDEVRDDMMSVVNILFEGLALKVVGSDESGLSIKARLT